MLKYSISMNIILVIVTIVLSIKYRTRTKQTRQLFMRAWYLETRLIDIYNHCSEEVQKKIDEVLNKIKPL
jgi:hypothetical protein